MNASITQERAIRYGLDGYFIHHVSQRGPSGEVVVFFGETSRSQPHVALINSDGSIESLVIRQKQDGNDSGMLPDDYYEWGW